MRNCYLGVRMDQVNVSQKDKAEACGQHFCRCCNCLPLTCAFAIDAISDCIIDCFSFRWDQPKCCTQKYGCGYVFTILEKADMCGSGCVACLQVNPTTDDDNKKLKLKTCMMCPCVACYNCCYCIGTSSHNGIRECCLEISACCDLVCQCLCCKTNRTPAVMPVTSTQQMH